MDKREHGVAAVGGRADLRVQLSARPRLWLNLAFANKKMLQHAFCSVTLFLVLSTAACVAVEVDAHYADEETLTKAMMTVGALKRAAVIRDSATYLVFSGGRGSTFRVFRTFIYRRTKTGFALAFQNTFNATREGFRTAAVFPEIRADGITLFAQNVDGDRKLTSITFDELNSSVRSKGEQDTPPNFGERSR